VSGNGYTKNGWRVTFDTDACSLCEICVNHCSNHALIARRKDTELTILFDHRQCDGCLGQAFCQEHCPEDAVTVSRAPLDELPDEPVSLITGELAKCEKCGNPFMPERKLATLLDQKKITPKPVQRICPNCRRGQLMDSYLNILDQGS
jgi:Pyruvate/2-oxoacid:ferredoxin oxidoreductase delta subunit